MRGHREEEPKNGFQASLEPLEASGSGQQPERSQSKGLLRRMRDALKRPSSGGSKMDRQESRMDRQESVLLPNEAGDMLPETGAQQGERELHERSRMPDSRPHRSSRHRHACSWLCIAMTPPRAVSCVWQVHQVHMCQGFRKHLSVHSRMLLSALSNVCL